MGEGGTNTRCKERSYSLIHFQESMSVLNFVAGRGYLTSICYWDFIILTMSCRNIKDKH